MKRAALVALAFACAGCLNNSFDPSPADRELAPIAHVGKLTLLRPDGRRPTAKLTLYSPGIGIQAALDDSMLTTVWDSTGVDIEHKLYFRAFYHADTIVFEGVATPGTIYSYKGELEWRGSAGATLGIWRVGT